MNWCRRPWCSWKIYNNIGSLQMWSLATPVSSACQAQPWWLAIQLGLSPSPVCVTPSLVTYNATISSCRDTWVEALALFASLLRSRTSPDVVTSNAAISACCTYWQRAFLLFHELRIAEQMQRDIMTDIITYGAVIKASENAALWQSAVSSLGELNIQSLQIDVIACNSSISACEKAAQWHAINFAFSQSNTSEAHCWCLEIFSLISRVLDFAQRIIMIIYI